MNWIIGYTGAMLLGISLGMMGGGGGILAVPVFVYLFHVDPVVATGYSLFVVGTSAAFGAIRYHRRDEINYRVGVLFALPAFAGVFTARDIILPALPDPLISTSVLTVTEGTFIMVLFGLLMLLASVSMIRSTAKPVTGTDHRYLPLLLKGFMVGLVTGLVGAGGGFLIVPALVLFVNLPMKAAVGTSLAIIAANALFGFVISLHHQEIDWLFLLGFSSVALMGILVGGRLNSRFNDQSLKRIFGWFVLLVGTATLVRQSMEMF